MFSESVIDQRSIQGYLETNYHVHRDAPVMLNIGVANARLAALHKAHRVEASASLTACNPFSQALGESANSQRQATLARELQQCSLTYIEGIGLNRPEFELTPEVGRLLSCRSGGAY